MELAIVNIQGKKTSKKAKLNDSVFAIEPNDHAVYLDVKQYLANQRQGTHKSKERSDITGSRRKIRKQKGTGSARVGDIKNPIFRGGGRAFGPRPRSYSFKLNKKLKHVARKSALSYKAKDECLTVLEDFKFDQPKTKEYVSLLANLEMTDSKTLLILAENDTNIVLAARNIPKATVISASHLNTYQILNAKNLLVSESAITEIEKTFAQSQ
ncbi:MAG: 50S ribosomal protein L4 [Flavobacteriales bacterium]|nr:50S ribosomal protein L4 [Flavobacteriales bacterium]MBL4734859.1 50S ribosomal protein L4 [Flavobacteriales bacterium]